MNNSIIRFIGNVRRLVPDAVTGCIYRNQLISNTARRMLNLIAPAELMDVAVAAGLARGMRLRLNLKEEKYYWLGTYEPMVQKAINDFTQAGMVVYDVGAHIGYWSLCFARIVGPSGGVFAFDVSPANVQRLRINIGLNSLERVIYPVPMAVCDVDEEVWFLIHSSGSMGKLEGVYGRDTGYVAKITVPASMLDTYVYQNGQTPPDLLKMDIEGSEVRAVLGMERILAEARPICLWELHGPEAADMALTTLWRHRYSVLRMKRTYPKITRGSTLAWKEYIVALP